MCLHKPLFLRKKKIIYFLNYYLLGVQQIQPGIAAGWLWMCPVMAPCRDARAWSHGAAQNPSSRSPAPGTHPWKSSRANPASLLLIFFTQLKAQGESTRVGAALHIRTSRKVGFSYRIPSFFPPNYLHGVQHLAPTSPRGSWQRFGAQRLQKHLHRPRGLRGTCIQIHRGSATSWNKRSDVFSSFLACLMPYL